MKRSKQNSFLLWSPLEPQIHQTKCLFDISVKSLCLAFAPNGQNWYSIYPFLDAAALFVNQIQVSFQDDNTAQRSC